LLNLRDAQLKNVCREDSLEIGAGKRKEDAVGKGWQEMFDTARLALPIRRWHIPAI